MQAGCEPLASYSTHKGNLPDSDEAFDRNYAEWEESDWMDWLSENLHFPFKATREEDEDDACFQEGAAQVLFRLGHTLEITGLGEDDIDMGIIVQASEKGNRGRRAKCHWAI